MRTALLLAVVVGAATAVDGQAPRPDTLRGVVFTGDDSLPVPGRTVVLHRITPDTGMAVDSVRTRGDGRFAIPFRRGPGDVVLASVRHEGVLYFGPALHGPRTVDDYRIRVYPTLSADSDRGLVVARRTLVVSSEGDRLRFMDAVDVSGSPDATLVGPEGPDGGAWWRVSLPDGVGDVRVLPGGVGADAVEIGPDAVRLSAPVPASGQRVLLGYTAPVGAAVVVSAERPIRRLEVVVRGDQPEVRVEGLGEARPTRTGERSVRRYSARDVTGADTVRIVLARSGGGAAGEGGPTAAWIAAALGLLFAIGAALTWRART